MKTIPTLYIGEYQSFGKQDLKKMSSHRATQSRQNMGGFKTFRKPRT